MPTASNPPRLALPISVVSVRAQAYSPDDQTVVISLTTKYSFVERNVLRSARMFG